MIKIDRVEETYMLSFDELIELVDKVSKSDITEFSYNMDGYEITLKKEKQLIVSQPGAMSGSSLTIDKAAINTVDKPAETDSSDDDESIYIVKSPIVGTFYASKEEGAEPLVKVGDAVKKDSIVAIVEAMKLMNEITAGADGTVTEIMVENGQLVEYGQELMKIKYA